MGSKMLLLLGKPGLREPEQGRWDWLGVTVARKVPEITGRMDLRAALGCQGPWEQDFRKRSVGGQESHEAILLALGQIESSSGFHD